MKRNIDKLLKTHYCIFFTCDTERTQSVVVSVLKKLVPGIFIITTRPGDE
jgi:hypothetical protein